MWTLPPKKRMGFFEMIELSSKTNYESGAKNQSEKIKKNLFFIINIILGNCVTFIFFLASLF